MGTAFIQKESVERVNLVNSTGADLAAGDLAVIGGRVLIADEAIASTARGSFTVGRGLVVQVSDFVSGEATFGTANADVFFKSTTGEFSDTSTAGYYPVGIVHTVKNSNDVVLVLLNEYTTAVPEAAE